MAQAGEHWGRLFCITASSNLNLGWKKLRLDSHSNFKLVKLTLSLMSGSMVSRPPTARLLAF